mmetsp:Transcript_36627/g.87419  ORF Transcript_36627/g.87419 Transcript_36627/m.87419 type:complete len:446 (+) Transcript_36627:83-1420(+)
MVLLLSRFFPPQRVTLSETSVLCGVQCVPACGSTIGRLHLAILLVFGDWVRRRGAMFVSACIAMAFGCRLGEALALGSPLQSAARHSIGGRRSGSAVFAESQPAGSSATVAMTLDDIQEAKDSALRGNVTSASQLVNVLVANRETTSYDQYLDSMLDEQAPFWTRLPLAKISRRARQRRLCELLDMTTPMDADGGKEDVDSRLKRRRRALFILLRNISTSSDYEGISKLLLAAKKDAKSNMSQEEMLRRTPDLETPTYEVLSRGKDGLEIRHYLRFSVASVKMGELKSTGSDQESIQKISNPQLAGASSFGALAGYLFGKNQDATAMSMTTPVYSTGEGMERTMSFVLPSDYWEDEGKAPKPIEDSAVKIAPVDGCDRAVIAFSGLGRKGDVDKQRRKLIELLKSNDDWRAAEGVPVVLAQYNDPFTPPWKRRNEVSVEVSPQSQ